MELPDPVQLVIFDLDGTLLDSVHDIAASTDTLRAGFGLPPLPVEFVRRAIGDGARTLVERVLADVEAPYDFEERFAEFLETYRQESLRSSPWRTGAREFLEAWNGPMALLTNKPDALTRELLQHLGVEQLFQTIGTPESLGCTKPDPSGMGKILEEHGVDPAQGVFVGDSEPDFLTGVRAKVPCVGIRGGYFRGGEPEPDIWVESFEELASVLTPPR